MKRIIAFVLIAVLTLTALISCTPPAPEKCEVCVDKDSNGICDVCGSEVKTEDTPPAETYTFTLSIVDHNEDGIEGVKVKFLYDGKESEVYTTNSNGKIVAEIATERSVEVVFVEAEGFSTNVAKKKRTFDTLIYTLEIKLTPLAEVIFVDEDGNRVAGVSATMCNDATCLAGSKTSGEDGVCEFALAPAGIYKVRIFSVPEGYEMPEALEGTNTPDDIYDDYHAYFVEGESSLTITLKKAA